MAPREELDMTRTGLLALLAAGFVLGGCPSGNDDDVTDDDSAGDDDVGDDDAGDDDSDISCDTLSPPGYGGTNGYHLVLDDGTDLVVDNLPYESEVSAGNNALAVSVDNGDPPGTPLPDVDYIWTTFGASPYTTVTAGAQPLQSLHKLGPAVTLNITDYPSGGTKLWTFALHAEFPAYQGTANCQQAPAVDHAFQCAYDVVLPRVAIDEETFENYVAGCAAVSGAFDAQLVPAS